MAENTLNSQGAKSVMSDDMQNLQSGAEDISNKASGYKAAISNPNTSDKAKAEAKAKLEALGGEDAFYGKTGNLTSESAEQNLEK